MIQRFSVLFAVLLFTLSASADERWRVSVLASELSTNDDQFSGGDGGLGVALTFVPSPSWDVELAVSSRAYRAPFIALTTIAHEGRNVTVPYTSLRRYSVLPVELTVARHFRTSSRVAPYVRAGIRHVEAPDSLWINIVSFDANGVVASGYQLPDRTSGEAGGGVLVRLTPRTALRAEVMRLLRASEVQFDPLTRASAGLSFKF